MSLSLVEEKMGQRIKRLCSEFSLHITRTFYPIPPYNTRHSIKCTYVKIDPGTAVRRVNQFTFIIFCITFQFVQFSHDRRRDAVIFTIDFALSWNYCRIVPQIIERIPVRLVVTQPLSVSLPMTVDLLASETAINNYSHGSFRIGKVTWVKTETDKAH